MILDSYKQRSLTFRIDYKTAFELWDNAGAIAREMDSLWGTLAIRNPTPNQQTLENEIVQLIMGVDQTFISIKNGMGFDPPTRSRIEKSIYIIRKILNLRAYNRVSARVGYVKEAKTFEAANGLVRAFGCVKWPQQKVFSQDPQSELNGLSFGYRFQDKNSFTLLDVKAEQQKFHIEVDPVFDSAPIDSVKNFCVIEFDRGTLGETDADKFRLNDWLDGFLHVMRRDIDKVLEGDL